MELNVFIDTVISQISEGILSAQKSLKDVDGLVYPSGLSRTSTGGSFLENQTPVSMVDFEVVLTDASGSEKKAGVGVFFGGIGAGGHNVTDVQNTSVTKVKFSIPVLFPRHKE